MSLQSYIQHRKEKRRQTIRRRSALSFLGSIFDHSLTCAALGASSQQLTKSMLYNSPVAHSMLSSCKNVNIPETINAVEREQGEHQPKTCCCETRCKCLDKKYACCRTCFKRSPSRVVYTHFIPTLCATYLRAFRQCVCVCVCVCVYLVYLCVPQDCAFQD